MKSNMLNFSKRISGLAVSSAMCLLATSISAHAMLPTPETEQVAAGVAQAQNAQAQNVQAQNTQAQKVVVSKTVAALVSVDAEGNPVLQPIDANTRLQKGNVIEYHGYFTNNSDDRMRKMDVTMSIPDEVKLVGEVFPKSASASLDGREYNHMPLRGRIDGQLQDLPLEYYKNLRWTIEGLEAHETAVVKYRAVVR
ncbi:hypothetical protein [Psychrobacter sp. FDAARGOS_221]|uniref:hypothetical protein n=1 Tax=Psychrobacter sp. FDAARGOS_221 TaxID=1975705 RepID=UPI000BB553AE|nr:hypothetical protein [Psychrobacter sp. FDAARGOS_221]PNK60575.1 hypothetical protein A6J60_006605 [Psychrobacter sp. FDAARGOS_221]